MTLLFTWSRRSASLSATGLLLAGLLCGCGSSDSPGSTTSETDSSTTPAAPLSSATERATDTTVTSDGEATVDAKNEGGDEVSLKVDFGEPATFTEMSSTAAGACGDQVDAGRSVVIPVQLTGQLTSSLAAKVTIEPVADSLVTDGDFHLDWAADFSDSGPTCHTDSDDSVFGVTWSDIAPGSTRSFTGYLVIDGAISPNDPEGTSLASKTLIYPRILINGELVSNDYDPELTASGSRSMDCPVGRPDGTVAAVAINREVAVANGCDDLTP